VTADEPAQSWNLIKKYDLSGLALRPRSCNNVRSYVIGLSTLYLSIVVQFSSRVKESTYHDRQSFPLNVSGNLPGPGKH
jgi:hypothetical protein